MMQATMMPEPAPFEGSPIVHPLLWVPCRGIPVVWVNLLHSTAVPLPLV